VLTLVDGRPLLRDARGNLYDPASFAPVHL
jgi:hypothetical protein